MAELSFAPPPGRGALTGQLGVRLGDLDPSLRVVARDLLAAERPIDFVAVDSAGRAVLVLVGEARGDLALVAQGLAHHAWVAPRLGDWLQLAPNLGIRPEAGVRVVLLSPDFGPEARAAARAVSGAPLELATYRWVRNGAWEAALVEWLEAPSPPRAPDRSERADGPPPGRPAPVPSPVSPRPSPVSPRPAPDPAPGDAAAPPAKFRTGLREEDLLLDPSERSALD